MDPPAVLEHAPGAFQRGRHGPGIAPQGGLAAPAPVGPAETEAAAPGQQEELPESAQRVAGSLNGPHRGWILAGINAVGSLLVDYDSHLPIVTRSGDLPLDYHSIVQDVYRKAAQTPDSSLCCVPQTPRYLPGLHVPPIMHEMNYGCGTTVHLQDMTEGQTVLYVGVGGGLEALQLAYFTRRPGGVIAVDPVARMRQAAEANLRLAARTNDWFDPSYVEIRDGNALDLPVEDDSIDLAAQNCLFNIFKTAQPGSNGSGQGDLERALGQMHRVLKRAGRLAMCDPISPRPMPRHLQEDEMLRAQCISGALTCADYLDRIVQAGFGSVEVRSRRPYRMVDRRRYDLEADLMLESIEVCAFKVPTPADGPCIFTGRTAIYTGPEEQFVDGQGHVLARDLPLPVCDKTAGALAALGREDLTVTPSTWHYGGGGCC